MRGRVARCQGAWGAFVILAAGPFAPAARGEIDLGDIVGGGDGTGAGPLGLRP